VRRAHRNPSSQSHFDTMVRTAHPTALTHPKQIQKQFTTEAQRHREKRLVLLTAPVAQLTK